MLLFRTLDQHVKWRGKRIAPYTEVEVDEEDEEHMAIWLELVQKKVAEGPQVAEELPEDDENLDQSEPTALPEPEKPSARRRKPKKS